MIIFRTQGFIFRKYRTRCTKYRTASTVAKPYFDAPRSTIQEDVCFTVPGLFATVFLKMNPWGSKRAYVANIVKNWIKLERCILSVWSVWLLVTHLTSEGLTSPSSLLSPWSRTWGGVTSVSLSIRASSVPCPSGGVAELRTAHQSAALGAELSILNSMSITA